MPVLAMLLISQFALAACPATAEMLRTDIEAAEQAYADWSWEAFDQALASGRKEIECLEEVPPLPDVQAVHRLFMLVGTRTQDLELAQWAFGGLLAADPTYAPDFVLAPKGSLLRTAYERATAADPGPGHPLPPGEWYIDGQPGATELPAHRASLVQQLSTDGTLSSWYVAGTELPDVLASRLVVSTEPEPVAPPPFPVEPATTPAAGSLADAAALPVPATTKSDKGAHRSRGLLVGGLALAAVGVGGMAYGELLEGQMDDTEVRRTAQSKYQLGLATTFGGYAVSTAGGAMVVGAVVKGSW